jgi:hypothetical protein
MVHRLAAVVVVVATVGVAACAPPSPPSGYVPCAIERPALGRARLPAHLIGLPDTVDDLWDGTWLSAELPVALPPSDTAVRARLQMDERGRVGRGRLELAHQLSPTGNPTFSRSTGVAGRGELAGATMSMPTA